MTNNQHGQVPEALIDLIDAYAETRHRYGRIHNARTEAARNAVIEALSGVQALSAAPEAFLKSVIALCSHRGYSPANIEAWDKDDKWIADLWRQAESMLAASPTPPAEQQATTTGAALGVAPGVAYTNKPDAVAWLAEYGGDVFTYAQLLEFADRTHALRLQAAPKAAPGDAIDEAMRERDDAEDFIDALLDEVLGHERPEWSSSYGRADALNDVQERMASLHKPAADKAWGQFQSAMAAPQPAPHLPERDASLPAERQGLFRKFVVGRVDGSDKPGGKHHGCTYFVLDVDHDPCARPALAAYAAACESTHPTLAADLRTKWGVVPAPQPAPAPLSEMPYEKRKAIQEGEQISASDAWFHARINMLDTLDRRNVFRAGFDRGWNAALDAQGGKDA